MKTSVIIGRFQIDTPHMGHRWLIEKVIRDSMSGIDSRLVVLVGCTEGVTDKNPMDYGTRLLMLRKIVPSTTAFHRINDHPSDRHWSKQVDKILDQYENVTLYCSREGFKNSYYGNHPVVELETPVSYSASTRREEIAKIPIDSEDFRKGVIYSVMNRFPIVYPTVDIALLKLDPFSEEDDLPSRKVFILLGKKIGDEFWRFPGGFVDPSDESLEAAAARELKEEVGDILHHGVKYVSSHKINDFRYRGSKDGVMTNLFLAWHFAKDPKASDDLAEV